jgi:hypothetical protein
MLRRASLRPKPVDNVPVGIEEAHRRDGPFLDLVLPPGLAEQVLGPEDGGFVVGLVSKEQRIHVTNGCER